MIHPERVRVMNDRETIKGRYVLYWMQASQRAQCNHALEWAIRRAKEADLPVVACFGVTDRYPEANLRHTTFMLQGLRETRAALADRGVQLVVRRGSPPEVALSLAAEAALVVMDRGYTRVQREWRQQVAHEAPCRVAQVETDVVVPVGVTSDKEEYAARTLRPRIHRNLERFLAPLEETEPGRDSLDMDLDSEDLTDPEDFLQDMDIDRSVGPVTAFRGGFTKARRLLAEFLAHKLDDYAELRNEPALDAVSHMSPYLHFGQISPLEIALQVREAPGEGADAYLEELIVRRELSINFLEYNPRYDQYECLPDWARKTLEEHGADAREFTYSREELEQAGTHDPYWNAAQQEMVLTGKMHNYMRMYWGKKILEWSETPREAFETALVLNNRYELDGRDPNSFAGVAWCFGKHDRPWKERAVFGKVRYMNAAGLERKFDMEAYLEKVAELR